MNILVESYVILKNFDESAVMLNPILEQYGYHIVILNIEELEKDFSDVFSIPPDAKKQGIYKFDEYEVSKFFGDLIIGHHFFRQIFDISNELILLKRIKDLEISKQNYSFLMRKSNEMWTFSRELIMQLRLIQHGDIDCPLLFLIDKDSRHTRHRLEDLNLSRGYSKYVINKSDIIKFTNELKFPNVSNKLTELAKTTFNMSYNIEDKRLRFVTLMICLESLFNQGRDQITHIISRHVAIILSSNKIEFNQNFIKIKGFYKHRSTIVHGDQLSHKVVIEDITKELEDIVRVAIRYCDNFQYSKEELFIELNSHGY